MSTDLKQFLSNWTNNVAYFDMLQLLARLSKLFSENSTPYLDYRIAENVFCKYFSAKNEARSCHAFDAKLDSIGVGIKTFILKANGTSVEKIAEFDKLKAELDPLSDFRLAKKLAEFRNKGIDAAVNILGVDDRQYHIVGRMQNLLRIFNSPYEKIDISSIKMEKSNSVNTIRFSDDKNLYVFNRSKSVLMQQFRCPRNYKDVPVDVIEDPYEVLAKCFKRKISTKILLSNEEAENYVILPLYSTRDKDVPQKSGLNQWNAGGRDRDEDEVYISVPKFIHNKFPNFFPKGSFNLELPNGQCLSAKLCQQGAKGLMSNPNKALGKWILRDVLKKEPGELVTMRDLNILNIDSVKVAKLRSGNYKISFSKDYQSYENFIAGE